MYYTYFMNPKLFLCASLLVVLSFAANAQSITLATFNIRYANPADTGNLWVNRAPVVSNLIRFHDFDIFGTQEGLKNQLDDISNTLPQYSRYGIGRTDGKEAGEFSAIYYKKDKYKLLQSGDFWLSQTPDKPSLGWDATCCNRICSWVYLQELPTGKKFYVFNTHFDHQGKIARVESSKLIVRKIKEIAGSNPVLLTGDFNGDHNSEWYKTLADSEILNDAYGLVEYPYASNSSTNAFGKQLSGNHIIDHIFVSKEFSAEKWGILTDTYHGKFPSDHFPVMSVIKWK